jgi:phage protein U
VLRIEYKESAVYSNGGFFVLESVEEDSAEKLIDGADGEQSLSLATDRVERILTLIKSQNVAIYNKK